MGRGGCLHPEAVPLQDKMQRACAPLELCKCKDHLLFRTLVPRLVLPSTRHCPPVDTEHLKCNQEAEFAVVFNFSEISLKTNTGILLSMVGTA